MLPVWKGGELTNHYNLPWNNYTIFKTLTGKIKIHIVDIVF